APSDENELARMMATALRINTASSIRFPRGEVPGVALDAVPEALPVGKARVVREGGDVAFVSVGTMLPVAVAATVVDARFVKPLDDALLTDLARRCGRMVTFEEHARAGGFGSAVLELLAERGLTVPVLLAGLPDAFVEHGSLRQLKERYGLAPDPVYE